MRFLEGDGSSSVRIKASPSDDIEILTALRALGGDGVGSPSSRTIASPSNDMDIRNDGGDLKSFRCD
jgi:hypothetical protein